jgi:NodT family efflux transporter outer membrane factor (OMF) lipoprotein
VETAAANLQSAVESRQDVLVSLAAEVAVDYIDLWAFQARLAVAQDNLKAQQHTADITQQRFEGGFVSALDVANAKAQVATTTAQIPPLEPSAQQTIYALSVMLGEEPAALVKELSEARPIPIAPPAVPVGVPSDLLRRRPDIRAAESSIHAATAEIGVATADLYPRFNLTASGGLQGSHAEALTDWISRFWSIGPSVSWQIFSSGAVTANIEVQKALQEQSVITYRQTILAALQEVENALIASDKDQERRTALTQAVASNHKALQLATQLYSEGQTDFLNVLQAEGALFSTEDALSQSDQAVSTDLVVLYKALGGGWPAPTQPGAGR